MRFRPRNAFYLQISANDVLPLFLFLDDGHLDWMSDRILQHVLADLRPLILPKMRAEALGLFNSSASSSNKQGTVDVHRGDSYQFAYFFRKTEPHSVLIKTRTFTTAPPTTRGQPSTAQGYVGKRKTREHLHNVDSRKKRKSKEKSRATREHEALASDDEAKILLHSAPRRSARPRRPIEDGYREDNGMDEIIDVDLDEDEDLDVHDEYVPDQSPNLDDATSPTAVVIPQEMDLEIDEEEKPKPLMRLKYKGFSINGYCLCVVVEPWPRTETDTSKQSTATGVRAASEAPANYVAGPDLQRAETPLFLPESDAERGETPAPARRPRHRTIPPVPLFTESSSELETIKVEAEDDLVVFSQTLNAGGNFLPGLENDDEMDGAAFFGDADEAREF